MPKDGDSSPGQTPESSLLHGDNCFTEELQKMAMEELGEDEESRTNCLKELRAKLKNEAGLLWQDDDNFLLAFLRVKKFSVDRAFDLVKSFYNVVGKHPEVFYYSTVDWQTALGLKCLHFCSQRDMDGCTVALFRMSAWDIEALPVDQLMSVGFLSILHLLRHFSTQIAGMKIILDYEGFSYRQLLHARPNHVRLFVKMMQGAFPLRMRGLHIVNENELFKGVWMLMKQILSKKLTERVHIHSDNIQGLHEFIDRRILPVEYGGEQPECGSSDFEIKIQAAEDYTIYVYSFGYEKFRKRD